MSADVCRRIAVAAITTCQGLLQFTAVGRRSMASGAATVVPLRLLTVDDRMDDFTVNIGQSEISAGVAISHTLMVVAHQMQDCCVKVMR